MNLNKAFVLGNVTRDPETRSLPSGQQVASFGLATNRFYTDQSGQKKQDTEFHNIVCFGKLADIAQRFLTKGSLVLIEGRIKTRNWQNTQGTKNYRTEIIADALQLGPRGSSGSSANSGSFSSQAQAPQKGEDIPVIEENAPPTNSANFTDVGNSEEKEIDIRDIPF